MRRFQQFFTRYKKECIALLVFVLCLGIFSISYAFAAVEPVRSIVIQSENTDFASGEEGSWQVTKSGYWTNYGEAEVTLDVDTSLMTNNEYTDIIFVLDISGSMSGDKLDRVKNDSKELISSLLSNQNNRAALITFDTESRIVSELTNDEEQLTNEIDNLQVTGSTNYYQALVNVDSILQNYQKETDREMVILFLTDGYPNVDTPNEKAQYQYLKSKYPYITINGIQYEMGESILNPIKEISDNQFIADMETLNNVLFDASVSPVTYNTYQVVDYIDNENFTLESINDIKVTTGKVELAEENGRQKITWTLDNLASGREANLTMKLKLKEELIGQGGIYPTNESTKVISKIESQEEDVTTTYTPILADNYKVIYDGNAPDGSTVTNIPETYNYSVFSTIEISDQVPNCTGYEFKGWHITTDGVTRVGEDYFIMPGEDVIIKAEWSKIGITKSMNGTVNNMGDPIMAGEEWIENAPIGQSQITSIVFKDNLEIPSSAIYYWDVSDAGDGSVIAYAEDDGRGVGTYKVTIGGQGGVIASSTYYLFYRFENVESSDLTYLDTSQGRNMRCMFGHCDRLTNIIFGDNFDTSNIISMSGMFMYCESITNLDLSNFNTSIVTDMNQMFYWCTNLISLDLSSFDTSRVTNMESMFEMSNRISSNSSITKLTSIIFGENWNTDKVRYMGSMFQACDALTNVDLSNFNTRQVTDMSYMFSNCRSLTSLDVSNFDTSQVTNMSDMFSECEKITTLNLSSFDTSQVTNMSDMFSGCEEITTLNLSSFDTSQVTSMYAMFNQCGGLSNLDVSNFNTSQVTNMGSMFSNCMSLISLDVSNFDTSQVTDMYSMFDSCSSLPSLNLSNFNTSQVTNMKYMFYECDSLINLDVSSFETSQVTDMSQMFEWCNNLTNLNLSSFDTSQVTTMKRMFSRCTGLTSLDLSSFDTSRVTDMNYMFCGNGNYMLLQTIHFGNDWDTSQVTNMERMFGNCSNLTSIDLSKFDTHQVTYMNSMFSGCHSLTRLDLSSFDTSKVTNMSFMFDSCNKLTDLDLSSFDTSQVTSMQQMFNGCSSLTSLNLSSFDTVKVTNMSYMFSNCSSLTSLDLSSFDTNEVINMNYMFSNCSSLTNLDMRNATFNATSYLSMFRYVANGINIIVKDATAKTWIESRLSDKGITGTVTIASA